MGAMEWMVMYIILLNVTSNKGCRVWATTIGCQNNFAPFQCCACVVVKIYVITSDIRSKCTCSKCILCIPFILYGSLNEWLHTCNACINNNLEIRIAGSSCRPWLSFKQIQTCQYVLANSFWVKLINAWHFGPVMTGVSENVPATSAYFQQFSEDFQTLPKTVWSCSDNLWEILKCQKEIELNFCH